MPRNFSEQVRTALRQEVEVRKLERLALKELRPKMQRLKNISLRNNSREIDLSFMHKPIFNALIAAHLKGVHRVQILSKTKVGPRDLSLDTTTDVLRRLEEITQVEIEQLRFQYEEETVRVIENLTTRLDQGLRTAVADATVAQLNPKQAARDYFKRSGFDPEKAYFYENLLRTQMQLAYNRAQYESYQDPNIDGIIWGFSYHTVGDERVRPNHEAMNGVVLPKNDPFWSINWPPNGYQCRCTVIPIFTSERKQFKVRRTNAIPDDGFQFNPIDLAL